MTSGEPYDVFRAQIGDRITVKGHTPDHRTDMTVSRLSPAGSGGRRVSAGPAVSAHVRPGGYAVTFDADTKSVYDPRYA